MEPESDHELMQKFGIRFIGMVAEADLRGMTPLAVFFEQLDEIRASDPERARLIERLLPRVTRIEYYHWRRPPEPAG